MFIFIMQKLQERKSQFQKCKIPDKEKAKWEKALVADLMSSEESSPENADKIIVKPIPWRSDKVNSFFDCLDIKMKQVQSEQTKRQRKEQIISHEVSKRTQPDSSALPKWVFAG